MLTDAQIAARHRTFNASEAAAMLGLDPHTSRAELLRMKAIGNQKEFSGYQKKILEDGHRYEASALRLAEEFIGDAFFPSAGQSIQVSGIARRLAATPDAITFEESIGWEHKSLNQELRQSLSQGIIPARYRPQLEQCLLVFGADRWLFTASNGTAESALHVWYDPDPALRERIIAGWRQFEADLDAYEHREADKIPEGEVQGDVLGAIVVLAKGEVVQSNLPAAIERLDGYLSRITLDLQSDQDFATAEKVVKACEVAEAELERVSKQILAQMDSVNDQYRMADDARQRARAKRLPLERAIKDRKEAIKAGIIAEARKSLAEHVSGLVEMLGVAAHIETTADFAGAMRGKKTLSSMRDAIDTELALCKVVAGEIAQRASANIKSIPADARHLFPDLASVCLKSAEDFRATLISRVAAEAERLRVVAEAERLRVAAEEDPQQAAIKAAPPVKSTAQPVRDPVEDFLASWPNLGKSDRQRAGTWIRRYLEWLGSTH